MRVSGRRADEGERDQISPSGGERKQFRLPPPSSFLPPLPEGRLGSLGGQALTFPLHASGQALLIAAVLTAVPLALVHCAVLVVPAGVGQVLANGALEEAFAALATVNAIVFA